MAASSSSTSSQSSESLPSAHSDNVLPASDKYLARSSPSPISHFFFVVVCYAVLRLSLEHFLGWEYFAEQPELSTPLSSWRRMQEAVHLSQHEKHEKHETDNGEVVQGKFMEIGFLETPFALFMGSLLLQLPPLLLPWAFLAFDLFTAIQLAYLAQGPLAVAIFASYLINPVTLLSSTARSTQVFSNFLLSIAFHCSWRFHWDSNKGKTGNKSFLGDYDPAAAHPGRIALLISSFTIAVVVVQNPVYLVLAPALLLSPLPLSVVPASVANAPTTTTTTNASRQYHSSTSNVSMASPATAARVESAKSDDAPGSAILDLIFAPFTLFGLFFAILVSLFQQWSSNCFISTLMAVWNMVDVAPNIGVWWYLFSEAFPFFQSYFAAMVILYLLTQATLVYYFMFVVPPIIPMSPLSPSLGLAHSSCPRSFHDSSSIDDPIAALSSSSEGNQNVYKYTKSNRMSQARHRHIVTLWMLLGMIALWRPYPSWADYCLFSALLPILSRHFSRCKYLSLTASALCTTAVLMPLFRHLWLVQGSGNANYYFATALVQSAMLITFMVDLANRSLSAP